MQTLTKTTEQVIYEMLTENTGTHLLDSGGAYGRNWERNQLKTLEDFRREPRVSVSYGEAVVSVFHFLNEHLSYEEGLDLDFQKFRDNASDDAYDLEIMETYAQQVASNPDTIWSYNTYNGDNPLSQTLQFVTFEIGSRFFVLLQVHGGCDVRGGYTGPKLFTADYEMFAGDLDRVSLQCECGSVIDYVSGYENYFEHGDNCGEGCGGTGNLIPNDTPPNYGEAWNVGHGCPCCGTKY